MISLIIRLFVAHPKLMIGFGVITTILAAYVTFSSWQDVQTTSSGPSAMTLSEADERLASGESNVYVRITNAHWDCDTVLLINDNTKVFLLDDSDESAAIVTFSDEMGCAQLPDEPTGLIRYPNERNYLYESSHYDLSEYPSRTSILALCAYCDAGNSQGGVIIGIIFIFVGLSFLPLSWWVQRSGL